MKGTVFAPEGFPALAAVVLVHGAGQEHRNPGFARAFAERGIAVLTYDKRGVGQSGGVYAGQELGTNNVSRLNLELLSLDAAAALRALGREKPLHGVRLGFGGVSQVVPNSGNQVVPIRGNRVGPNRGNSGFPTRHPTAHDRCMTR